MTQKPEDDEGDNSFSADEKQARGFVPEFVRKMAVAGLGAVFMGEEGLRNLAGQLKLPKEALGYLLGQAEKTKDEVTRIASEEIRRFLQSDKLRDEFLKLLSSMTLEVKAEIKLVPDKLKDKPTEEPSTAGPKITISELKIRPQKHKKKE